MVLMCCLKGSEWWCVWIVWVFSCLLVFVLFLLLLIFVLEVMLLQGCWFDQLLWLLYIGLIVCVIWCLVWVVVVGEQVILCDYLMEVVDNLEVCCIQIQICVFSCVLMGVIILVGVLLILLIFLMVCQIGMVLLVLVGIIGLVVGIVVKLVFGNLIVGLQIVLIQLICLDDVVIVEGEWGWVEEIGSSYVVVWIWDEWCMVVLLMWFIEYLFQNWIWCSVDLLGMVFLWFDYWVLINVICVELEWICYVELFWDGWVCVIQVIEMLEYIVQVCLLVSVCNFGDVFDLCCLVCEWMLDFIVCEYLQVLFCICVELFWQFDLLQWLDVQLLDGVCLFGVEDGLQSQLLVGWCMDVCYFGSLGIQEWLVGLCCVRWCVQYFRGVLYVVVVCWF